MSLRGRYGTIDSLEVVLIDHLASEYFFKLWFYIQLEIWGENFDFLELKLLQFDTLEFVARQDANV